MSYDIKDRLFWVKFNRLEKVREAMIVVANNYFIDADPFKQFENNYDRNIRCAHSCVDSILSDYISDYHQGSFFTIDQSLASELGIDANELTSDILILSEKLKSLYLIAALHFDLIKALESNDLQDENMNFVNYLQRRCDYADEIKQIASDDPLLYIDKKEELLELIQKMKETDKDYDKNFEYPQENESPEEYLERVL